MNGQRHISKTQGWATTTTAIAVAVIAIGAALGIAVAAPSHSGATKVDASVREYSVALGQAQVGSGKIRLRVHNAGSVEHELVAFRTDLAEGAMPMKGDRINESGPGITHLDPEAEAIAAGTTKTITINLAKGRYVFVCNLAGHYQSGMHAVLTVS